MNSKNFIFPIQIWLQLLFGLIILVSLPVLAQSTEPIDPKMAKQYIAEILSQPEFKTTRQEYKWQYIGEPSSSPTPAEEAEETASKSISLWVYPFIKPIAQLLEILLWILLGIGIVLLMVYGSRWLKQQHSSKQIQQDYTATPRRLDNDARHISLPANISQQAWTLWRKGDASAAISLLYRGALSVLITRDRLAIDDSATESECLRQVRKKQTKELLSYFANLTRTWQNIAYAGRIPHEIEVQYLCQEWQQYFG